MNETLTEYFQPGKKNLFIIYILYVAALIADHPLLSIVGVTMAYVNKDSANDADSSHYVFLWRTFWMSLPIYLILYFISIVPFVGLGANFLFHVWYIVRIVFGVNFLLKDKPHPEPETWLFT